MYCTYSALLQHWVAWDGMYFTNREKKCVGALFDSKGVYFTQSPFFNRINSFVLGRWFHQRGSCRQARLALKREDCHKLETLYLNRLCSGVRHCHPYNTLFSFLLLSQRYQDHLKLPQPPNITSTSNPPRTPSIVVYSWHRAVVLRG